MYSNASICDAFAKRNKRNRHNRNMSYEASSQTIWSYGQKIGVWDGDMAFVLDSNASVTTRRHVGDLRWQLGAYNGIGYKLVIPTHANHCYYGKFPAREYWDSPLMPPDAYVTKIARSWRRYSDLPSNIFDEKGCNYFVKKPEYCFGNLNAHRTVDEKHWIVRTIVQNWYPKGRYFNRKFKTLKEIRAIITGFEQAFCLSFLEIEHWLEGQAGTRPLDRHPHRKIIKEKYHSFIEQLGGYEEEEIPF
jgi:hypothetical protein